VDADVAADVRFLRELAARHQFRETRAVLGVRIIEPQEQVELRRLVHDHVVVPDGRHLIALALLTVLRGMAQPPGELEAVVVTDLGTFRVEFAPEKAPKHVQHFVDLARRGYYDGGAFHRVAPFAVIQGGDPLLKDPKTPRNLWGTGGLNQLPAEFSDLKHERGTVSAVSIPDKKDSDGAQFFVCIAPQPALDGKYSAFGARQRGDGRGGENLAKPQRAGRNAGKTGASLEGDHREPENRAFPERTFRRTPEGRCPEDHARLDPDQDGAGVGAEPRPQVPDAREHRLV
jgi:peptidylprolyl isomerase